jgi:hypothetical protein
VAVGPAEIGPDAVLEVAITGRLALSGGSPDWLLYNGYHSWDRAGCASLSRGRRLPTEGGVESWWTAALADDTGGGVAAVAESGSEAATRFRSTGADFGVLWSDGVGPDPRPLVGADGGLTWSSPTVTLALSSDVRLCLAALARGGLHAPPVRGWVSWYHFGPFVAREDVLEHSQLLAREPFSELGFRLVQLDDGWQQAYGEWKPNAKFPGGLAALAREMERGGQCLGVWTAPFLVSASADLADEAPVDWFVHDAATGERLVDDRHRVLGPMFVLDGSRPGVQSYLRDLYAAMYADGVRYFKVDFLYAGGYAGSRALASGMQAIKEGVGDGYVLASGAPLSPMVGVAHGCRIGPDTATPLMDFDSWTPSPTVFADEVLQVGRNLAARHFLSGWFQLDADVALVGGNLSLEQARQLVTMAALAGGPFLVSDDLRRLPSERLELITNAEVLELSGGQPALPDWEPNLHDLPPTHWRRGDFLAVFNWTPQDSEVDLRAPGAVSARDVWEHAALPGFRDGMKLAIPANGVRLLRLSSG